MNNWPIFRTRSEINVHVPSVIDITTPAFTFILRDERDIIKLSFHFGIFIATNTDSYFARGMYECRDGEHVFS